MGLGQQEYINAVLTEKVIQFLLLPRIQSAFQQTNRRALVRAVRLGRAVIFGYEKEDFFEQSP